MVLIIEKSKRSYDFVKEYLTPKGFQEYAFLKGKFTSVTDDTLNVHWSKRPLA
ncbi:MAG: hypothetical protein ACK5XV_06135 [Flavobacteriales bacterium]